MNFDLFFLVGDSAILISIILYGILMYHVVV